MSVQRDLAAQCARAHCVLLAGRIKVIRHNESGLAVEKMHPSRDVRSERSSYLGCQVERAIFPFPDLSCGFEGRKTPHFSRKRRARNGAPKWKDPPILRDPIFSLNRLKRFLPLMHYLYVECIALV